MDLTWLIIWLVVTVVFAIIELATIQLVAIWFSIGAVCSMIACSFGAPIWVQLLVFGIVSFILIICTRPFVKKFLSVKHVSTNADRLIGKVAIVTQDIVNLKNEGAVKISGVTWTAVSESGNEIKSGKKVRINKIEGVKLIVSEIFPEDDQPEA